MKVELPELGYEYNALEPHFDAQTMEIHHTKHHQAYINKYNAAVEKFPELADKTPEELLANAKLIPDEIKGAVRDHGGGYVNHKLFWQILKKDVPLSGEIQTAINESFESFDKFKEVWANAAATLFGSGWVWLCLDKESKLQVVKSFNQDNPTMAGLKPILCLDVWEHAYYLKYQNKRPDYTQAFFHIINWEKVNELYLAAKQ